MSFNKIFAGFIALFFLTHIANAGLEPDVWDVLRNEFTLDHEVNRPEVQEQIRWLVAHPGYLYKASRQAEPYIYHIVTEIKKRGLPGELALLPMIESAYNPFAYSRVGAAGLWQLMPRTGSELGLKQDWWFDGRRGIDSSTDAALTHLISLNKQFNGNWTLAIAAYDAGGGAISRAIKTASTYTRTVYFWNLPVPAETKVYVPRFLALAEIMSNPVRYHLVLPSIPYFPYFKAVNIGSQIDLSQAAKLAGISYKELITLNPGYNRWSTAPYEPFKLLIPTEKAQRFHLNLSNVPEDRRVSWIKHQVNESDSLDSIAARYHTTATLIKQLNQLHSDRIQAKQFLLIPSTNNVTTPAFIPVKTKSPLAVRLAEVKDRRVIHIVQARDNWDKIQRIYHVTAKDIQQWNNLDTSNALKPGQALVIWKKATVPPVA